jgi:predicted  nucleic acid-binding Zn-ribbon protein
VKAELEKLVSLQQTDSNIRRLKKIVESADERRAAIEREFEQHAFSIREIQNRRDTLQAERTGLEKRVAESKILLERADRNLKHAQNQKEYESAMRETDALQKQISSCENQIIEKMSALEEVEKELADRADEINSLEAKRSEALAAFDAEVASSRENLQAETARRAEIFSTLPAQLASVYNRLVERSRDGVAVAEVSGGACSACFMSLRPQVLVEVKRGDQIIMCESCSRILYLPVSQPQSEATAV